ncbi:MAG: RNA-binding protein [Chloroflexi bacterium]|nr:RNA-binding protein [Chloroflexota bacterium]
MAARLYVGNLPYSATEDGLRQLFSQAGTVVEVALPMDRATGRPRGFGFVEMESNADAEEAVRKFDGYQLDNRSIRVQIAREREARPPGFRPSAGRGMGYGFGERREGRRPEGRRGRGRAA